MNRIPRRTLLLAGAGIAVAATVAESSARPCNAMPITAQPPAAAPAARRALKPVSHWAAVFQQSWDYESATAQPLSLSRDSQDHYDLAYTLDGNVAMFRATGATRYLDRALAYVENVVASAAPSTSLTRSTFRDRYRGWASSKSGQDGDEVPLYESYFWRYGTQLLTAMRQSAAVWGDPGYRARHARLLSFAEVDVFEKWYNRGAADTIYRDRTHMAAHWALIALNLGRLTGDTARATRYRQVYTTIGGRIRNQMIRNPVEPTAYFWNDVWGSTRRPGQDVGHGNGVMAYVVEARDQGTTWNAADMTAFGNLLTKVIWPGGTTYHGYVDGTGMDNGWIADGFVKLGRYDADVQHRLESYGVVNDQFAANMALNAKILRA
ncbi:hypothetical protein ACWT_5512 [Actinoplanes sp. SE50]|uniref:hypothetical protein n=1 Tax=unclassified Actinoplanes TaxID=2626549 RepID=UPI00023ECB84|nr:MULTISPECIES: hypothetical protein [unclassified Actinoplanes]AEV86529.1 hypothetical protein ACPL_5642 [Actinoplanes sp. SE50/110]ATO84927.1 hypothetical protein ACWT_5512 [Actinoplanes sp. SE50]SLM02336.1 hypothetical protein ACSP50_5575 [Actinoplanes sp. SE50/110]